MGAAAIAPGERDRAVARRDAGAVLPDVEVDHHLERPAGGRARAGEEVRIRRAIGDDHEVRAEPVERRETPAAFLR